MTLKKIILPVLGLIILGSFSYAQKLNDNFSWETEPGWRVNCKSADGNTYELIEIHKKYITQPDKHDLLIDCCRNSEVPNACRGVAMTDGNNLLHVYSYYGSAKLIKFAKEELGMLPKAAQLRAAIPGVQKGAYYKYRTGPMYAAEQNHVDAIEMYQQIITNHGDFNILSTADRYGNPLETKDYKKAIDLTSSAKIKDLLTPYLADIGSIKRAYQTAAKDLFEYFAPGNLAFNEAAEQIKSTGVFREVERMFKDGNSALGIS